MRIFRIGLEAITPCSFEELAARFHAEVDGIVVERDGRISAFMYVESDDAIEAAFTAVKQFEAIGASVVRTDPDLVDGPEIASRLGLTRQAVQNYARGTRGASFPRAIGSPGGKRIWAWGQITQWLMHQGKLDEPAALTQDEAVEIDAYLAQRRSAASGKKWQANLSWAVRSGSSKSTSGIPGSEDYTTRQLSLR